MKLREEPLPLLIREAGWRAIRSVRKSIFPIAMAGAAGNFRPIGYYQVQALPVSEQDKAAVLAYADAVLRGEYPLMGYGSPELGTKPDWQCDWVSGKKWPAEDSRKLRIVRHDGSDVKAPWELSRLQWSTVVAKAYVLSGERKYRDALRASLSDWIANNPVGTGVNWTVAMEAALRGISLCLTMELLWPFLEKERPWLEQMTDSLRQHLGFIEAYNEFSFLLRSNHYLSNIVGLTTLSAYLGLGRRREKYARAVQRELLLQTYADGGDCEASTGYHFLVAQLGLHSFRVQQQIDMVIPADFQARLAQMFTWMASLADDGYKLPHVGDCDNGRVELLMDDIAQSSLAADERHSLRIGSLCELAESLLPGLREQFFPHLARARYGAPTVVPQGAEVRGQNELSSRPERSGPEGPAVSFLCSRIMSKTAQTFPTPRQTFDERPALLLPESGVVVLRSGEASVLFLAMPNGLRGKGSHTHNDKLSVIFRLGADEIFCDSGSRYYTRSAERRNLDRSTRSHNTLMIDEAEQNVFSADPRLLFQCGNEATVSPMTLIEGGARASHQGYARIGIEHQRTVQLGEGWLLVVDEVSGMGERSLDLRFVLSPEWCVSTEKMTGETVSCGIAGRRRLSLQCESDQDLALSVLPTEISREYGSGLSASCIRIHTSAALPARLQTWVQWD
jgi:Heparinase II/III-like protein/Heparinase II/III N-terminus